MKVFASSLFVALFGACVSNGGAGPGSTEPSHDAIDGATKGDAHLAVPFGFVLVPRGYQVSPSAWLDVFTEARKARASFFSIGYKSWKETETGPGIFDWTDFAALPERRKGESIVFDIASPIGFAGDFDLPADLSVSSFEDETLEARYQAYLTSVLANLPDGTTHLTLHTEGVLEFLSAAPKQAESFCAFLAKSIRFIKQQRDQLRVGAYWRYENDKPELLACLNLETDYVALAAILNPPRDAPESIRTVVQRYANAVAPKPLALVEAGYPSSEAIQSSQAEQGAFVRALAAVVEEFRRALEFVAYYTVYDEEEQLLRNVADQVWGTDPAPEKNAFVAWSSSLGLKTTAGAEKLAWSVLAR